MPLYNYKCKNCGKEFEILHGTHEVVACPFCTSFQIEKIISPVSFSIKGGGVYKPGFSSKE